MKTGRVLLRHWTQEAIFSPLLLVIGVETLDEALNYIRQRPCPLALYYFGLSKKIQADVPSL